MQISLMKTSKFIAFFLLMSRVIEASKCRLIFARIGAFFAAAFSGCFVSRIGKRFGSMQEKRESSKFYALLDFIWQRIFGVFRAIYAASKSGVFFKGVKFLFSSSLLFRTENMLAITVLVMFVCPHEMWNNVYGLMMALGLCVLYLAALLRERSMGKSVKGIWLCFALFAFAVTLSVLTSISPGESIRVFVFFVTAFIFCILTYGVLTDGDRFTKLSAAIYAAVLISGLIAMYQKVMGVAIDPSLTDVSTSRGVPGRVFSTLANPNNYAEFLVIFMPLCIAFALTRKKAYEKVLLIGGLAIPLVALLLTYSRSSWLGFAFAMLIFAAFYNKKMLPVIIVLGICAIPVLPASILNRIATIGNLKDTSSSYRIDIWMGTLSLLGSYWLTGTGLGPEAFRKIYLLFSLPEARPAPHTHMLFMEVFAEMGIIGFAVFVVFIAALVVCSLKAAKRVKKESPMRLYVIAAASSMLGIMVMGFAEYIWFYPRVLTAFFIAIGFAMAAIRQSKKEA